jgi:predicted TIM-barrel fold metal-dependent hydrolase
MLIDSHTHVACGDDPRFPTNPQGVASDWWKDGGSVDDLMSDLVTNDVTKAVVVQAIGAYGYDCGCALASVATHPDRLAFVGSIDMTTTNPVVALTDLVADADIAGIRIAGLRLFAAGGGDSEWLGDGRLGDVIDAATSHGITLVPTLFSRHLHALRAALDTRPDAIIALDHCAFPDMAEGGRASGDASLLKLARYPNVSLKITSYVLEMADRDDHDPAPYVETLVEAFGTDRLCWGSDHPQDQRHSYAEKVALARTATRNLTVSERDAFFATTALRLFWP